MEWINHHRLFTHIKRTDNILLLLNLLLLLLIVFVPFPTALLTEYAVGPNRHLAATVYSGTFVITATCFNALWRYAAHENRLLGKNVDPHAVRAISDQYCSDLCCMLSHSAWPGSRPQQALP